MSNTVPVCGRISLLSRSPLLLCAVIVVWRRSWTESSCSWCSHNNITVCDWHTTLRLVPDDLSRVLSLHQQSGIKYWMQCDANGDSLRSKSHWTRLSQPSSRCHKLDHTRIDRKVCHRGGPARLMFASTRCTQMLGYECSGYLSTEQYVSFYSPFLIDLWGLLPPRCSSRPLGEVN